MSDKLDSSSEWKLKIDQWRSSGLSVQAWCHQNHIKYHTFLYWRQKLGKSESDQSKALSPSASFYEVLDSQKNTSGIEIEYHGAILRLGKDFDGATFQKCIKLLREL